jgi:hypothetical protein
MHEVVRSREKPRSGSLAVIWKHPRREMTRVLTMSVLLCSLRLERGHE